MSYYSDNANDLFQFYQSAVPELPCSVTVVLSGKTNRLSQSESDCTDC